MQMSTLDRTMLPERNIAQWHECKTGDRGHGAIEIDHALAGCSLES